MPKYTGIHHLAMVTGDMDCTIRFWRDLLGMRLIAGIGRKGYRHYFFEISENDMIAFFEWPGAEPVPEKDAGAVVRGPVVFDHVSFGVNSENELRELKDRLDTAGIWVSEVMNLGFFLSVFTFDPNGISLEFSVQIPENNPRQEPFMHDTEPSGAAREGPDPRLSDRPHSGGENLLETNVYTGELGRLFSMGINVWKKSGRE